MRLPILLALLALLAAPNAAAQPRNDNNLDALIVSTFFPNLGTNVGATLETGEAAPTCQTNQGASVWWYFRVPESAGTVTIDLSDSDFDTVLALYHDTFPNLPTAADEIDCNDDIGGGALQSRLENVALGPGFYLIRVSGFGAIPDEGNISFDISCTSCIGAPVNDDFANGPGVSVGTVTGTNVGASLEVGEAEPSCLPPDFSTSASVWWAYTPPSDGTIGLDLTATDFDAIVTVYPNTFPNLPTQSDEIACGDEDQGKPVLTDIPVQGGTTYAIRVASWSGAAGDVSFDLSFAPASTGPPNDDVANASPPQEPTTTGTNVGATVEPGEPDAMCQPNNGASVWWAFGVAGEGLLTLDFSNSSFDTVVSLHADDGTTLEEIDCDDDGGAAFTSLLSEVPVQPNTLYYLRVAGFDGGSGPDTGTISFESTLASATANEGDTPTALSLTAAPNPTRGDARVRLAVEETEHVTVAVFDATGRRVAVLHEGLVSAGAPLELRLGALPAGVYAVRALGETVRLTERVTVVR